MQIEFPLWRIWMAEKVPLSELRWEWSYPDVLKALAILDYEDACNLAYEGIQPEVKA